MTVQGVNNSNNNAGMYAAGAALVGGGAGAAAGWYSKPFLKDGAPTDSFVKKMSENLKEIMTPEEKEAAEMIQNKIDGFKNALNSATTVEELKNGIINNSFGDITNEMVLALKETEEGTVEILKTLNLPEKDIAKYSDLVRSTNTAEEFKNVMRTIMDQEYAGKSLEEIKNMELKALTKAEKSGAKATFELFWDNSKKAFVDCEEGAGKAIKKAAQSIQGKYAAIYGAIGAAALGLTTLLCLGGKKEPQE